MPTRIQPLLFLLLLFTPGSPPAQGAPSPAAPGKPAPIVYHYRIIAPRSRVSFLFRGLVVPFEGHFGILSGSLVMGGGPRFEGSSARLRIEAGTVTTQRPEQAAMLRHEVLETDRFPFIEVEITSARPAGPPRLRGREREYDLRVEGKVRLHGTERSIVLPVRLADTGTDLYIEASTAIRLSDYGMARPRVLLLVPGEDIVEVHVRLVAEPAPKG